MAAEAEGSLVPVPIPSAALGCWGHPKIPGELSSPACTAESALRGKGDGLGRSPVPFGGVQGGFGGAVGPQGVCGVSEVVFGVLWRVGGAHLASE